MAKAKKDPIVARFTQSELEAVQREAFANGRRIERECLADELQQLKRQYEQLNIDQTKAVTDLLRACHENLSKAGYLIGKLNNDKSR